MILYKLKCSKVRWAFFLFFLPQMLKRRTSALLPITFSGLLSVIEFKKQMFMNITNEEIGIAAGNYSKVEDEQGGGVNATKFNAFTAGCEFVLQLLQQPHVSGALPVRLETTKNGQSIVDANLKGVIIATANRSEWADEIVRRWNMVTDVGGNDR